MRISDEKGVSSVEILVASVIGMIAMAGVSSFSQMQSQTLTAQAGRLDEQTTARNAIELFSREVRLAGLDPSCSGAFDGIVSASTTQIQFNSDLDSDGAIDAATEEVRYQINTAGQLVRIQNQGSDLLVSGISLDDSRFFYLDANGNEIATPVSQDEIDSVRRIGIELTVGDAGGESMSLSTEVSLRSRFFVKPIECS